MTAQASSHATVELLSAYLDQELVGSEVHHLEDHLEQCAECHSRLEGLRKVVASLRRAERHDPPVDLEMAVARRIALAGQRESMLDRFETRLSIFNRQSTLLPLFAVVIALAVFMYLFAVGVEKHQNQRIPVIFGTPDTVENGSGETRRTAERVLRFEGGVWLEDGVSRDQVGRTVELDSDEGRRWLAEHPLLEQLPRPAVIRLDDEVVEIR